MKAIFVAVAIATVYIFLNATSALAQTLRGQLKTSSPTSFQVVSVSSSGTSTTTIPASNGKFSIKGSKNNTLHLLSSDGKYAGPIVLPKGAKAAATLSGSSGSLGAVQVKTGFATVSSKPRRSAFDLGRLIRYSRQTGPSGAGRLGLVRASGAAIKATDRGTGRPGDDSDKDGLPNLFDVDDDGDLELDGVDEDVIAPASIRTVFSDFFIPIDDSINVNSTGVTQEQIDQRVERYLKLVFFAASQIGESTSVDVDCSGLPYCNRTSGTATIFGSSPFFPPNGTPWISYDLNGDGFPNLAFIPDPPHREIAINPRQKTAGVRPGDTYLFNAMTDGKKSIVPVILPFYFVTTPAVTEYGDGVATTPVTYPLTPGGPGARDNPITLNGTRLTVTFWRPQRPGISGAESVPYIDMGGLFYGIYISMDAVVFPCALTDFSNQSTELVPTNAPGDKPGSPATIKVFKDASLDQVPNPTRTLQFSVDLAQCFARAGVSTSGAEFSFDLGARDIAGDTVLQQIKFRFP